MSICKTRGCPTEWLSQSSAGLFDLVLGGYLIIDKCSSQPDGLNNQIFKFSVYINCLVG
jgi:hypothetical protein